MIFSGECNLKGHREKLAGKQQAWAWGILKQGERKDWELESDIKANGSRSL